MKTVKDVVPEVIRLQAALMDIKIQYYEWRDKVDFVLPDDSSYSCASADAHIERTFNFVVDVLRHSKHPDQFPGTKNSGP